MKVNTIFKNSENSKTSDPHRLLHNLPDKITIRKRDQYVALSNLSIHYTWKNIKNPYENNKFNIPTPSRVINLNILIGHIVYQILKIILNMYQKT